MHRKLLSVVLLAGFLAWVVWYVNANTEAFRPVTLVSWPNALGLLLAFLAIMVGNGLFVAIVSRAFRIQLASTEWLCLSFASSFANYFLPFRGGVGIRALYMYRLHGLPISEFVSTLSIMYLMHTVVNGLLALVGMALVAINDGAGSTGLIIFFGLITLAGVAAMFVDVDIKGEYTRFPLAQLSRLILAWRRVRSNRLLVAKMWLLMVGITLATVWQCRLAFDAVSVSLSWEGIFVYAASKNLATLIGLTPGAIGVVELISIYLGNALGYGTAAALSVQGLMRAVAIVTLLLAAPVAFVYLRRRFDATRRPQTGAADA